MSCSDPAVINNGGGGDIGDGTGGDSTSVIFLGNPPVVINEIYSANADLNDEYGNTPGWVELYNPADTAVNLRGYSLTNNVARQMWEFGDVVIEARGYQVVFLSGLDQPDLEPSRDSIDLIASAEGAWSWADGHPPSPGRSTATHTFVRNRSISGTLFTRDNQPVQNWSTAVVMMVLKDWDTSAVVDLSSTNQVLLRGTVSKNSRLEVRFAQSGIDDWLSWGVGIVGTGVENDLYTIELPSVNTVFPNLERIYGIRFSNTPNIYGTINFSFNSIVARRRASNIHASFRLNNRGGSLYLMDTDGHIRDSVAYPAGALGLSYAKNSDNGTWALSKPPTPYTANSTNTFIGLVPPAEPTSIPSSGYYENTLTFTLPPVNENGVFMTCDTTGAMPSAESVLRSGATLSLTRTTMIRCAQFLPGAHQSETMMRTYIIGRSLPDLPVVSIAVDPYEMFDPTDGLYSMGPFASGVQPYFGANFWHNTELPIHIEFFENGVRQVWSYPAGLRIFGNWSRGNAKKSVAINFRDRYGHNRLNYPLFPEHPHLTRFKRLVLRNNGNNFPEDYIRDMLMTSLTEGLNVDYQKGRAVIVYYNGRYFGIHNLRERANERYFETNYNIDRDYLDLVKTNGGVNSGSDADYQDILRWVGSRTLSDEDVRALGERMDLDDFTNNHQCRIYYHDRDWPGNNMKRWRTNSPPSKWRWLMYDTDHGFGGYGIYHQPSVSSLAFATATNGPDWPNPPHTTLILRKLLENEGYKNAFINRFSLLIATYFAPARVDARINTLMAAIESEIPQDQARWNHNVSRMSSQLQVIRSFGRSRPAQMQSEIETFFRLDAGSSANFTVSANGNGNVLVDNLKVLGGSATFKAYASVPVTLKAEGAGFVEWSDGVKDAVRVVNVTGPVTLEARFGAAAL